MKEKEFLDLGFKPTPKKHFYYRQIDQLILIGQAMRHSFALLTSVNATPSIKTFLNRLAIHDDTIKRAYIDEDGLGIIVNDKISLDHMQSLINELVQELQGNPCLCRRCHQVKQIQVVHVDQQIELLCKECQEEVALAPHQPHIRMVLGLCASFILCLIPALIWGYCHQVGMIIVLDGLLFGLISYLAFRIFAGGVNRKGFWLSYLMSYLALWVGELINLIFSIKNAYGTVTTESITIRESIRVLPAFLGDADVLGIILFYHIMSLALTLIVYAAAHKIYKKRHSKPIATMD